MKNYLFILSYYYFNFLHYKISSFCDKKIEDSLTKKILYFFLFLFLFEYANLIIKAIALLQNNLFSFLNLNYKYSVANFSYSMIYNNLLEINFISIFLSIIFLKIFINIYTYFLIDFFGDHKRDSSLPMYSSFWNNQYNNKYYLQFSEDNQKQRLKYKINDIIFLKNKKENTALDKNYFYFLFYFTNIEIVISVLPLFFILSLLNFFWIFTFFNFIVIFLSIVILEFAIFYGMYEFFSEKYYSTGHKFYSIIKLNKKHILKNSFLNSCKR